MTPEAVPARLQTTVAGRASVGDGELRAVEVSVTSGDWIPFTDGWPWGKRPVSARRPAATGPTASPAPSSSFVDTDEQVRWDPATDPANAELITELEGIGAWYGDTGDGEAIAGVE